jgi:hypothetical protein
MWKEGDQYWSLWMRGRNGEYFTQFEGIVWCVDGDIVRLIGGGWRLLEEVAFSSRRAAEEYIARQPARPVTNAPTSAVRARDWLTSTPVASPHTSPHVPPPANRDSHSAAISAAARASRSVIR